MKPSHDDLEDARQRCQEHYESCDCQHAQIAKEIEPLLTGPIRQILHVLSRCDRAAAYVTQPGPRRTTTVRGKAPADERPKDPM
jgi:hypothetical protein